MIFGRVDAVFPKEGAALHLGIVFQPGEREHGGSEINEGDNLIAGFPGGKGGESLPLLGNVNDHGNTDAAVVEVSFPPGSGAAVITIVKNEGVVSEAVFFELCENLTDLLVGGGHDVVVAGDIAPDFGEVGKVSREGESGRVQSGLGWDHPLSTGALEFWREE